MATRESGAPDEGRSRSEIARRYGMAEPPQDVRARPGVVVNRTTPQFAPELGGAAKKDYVNPGGGQPNSLVRDRQGLHSPGGRSK